MDAPRTRSVENGRWLGISAAAELLGLSRSTLRRWDASGRLPCSRTAGGQRRFRRADLERLLTASPQGGAARAAHPSFVTPRTKSARGGIAALDAAGWEILKTLQEGILVIDAQSHVIVEVNPAAAALFGADRGAIVGHVCHRFVCPKERGQCPISDLGQTIDRAERVLVTADGRLLPVLKTVTTMSSGGREYLVESLLDMSELRQFEEHNARMTALLESSQVLTTRLESQLELRRVLLELSGSLITAQNHDEAFSRIATLVRRVVDYDCPRSAWSTPPLRSSTAGT